MKGQFASIALVLIGCVALAANLGYFELDLVALLRDWWPLGLVALGVALYFTPDDRPRA